MIRVGVVAGLPVGQPVRDVEGVAVHKIMTELKTGDVVRLTNINHQNPLPPGASGVLNVSFKPPKGQVFVCLLLGVEPKDGSAPLDVEKRLNEFGWQAGDPDHI